MCWVLILLCICSHPCGLHTGCGLVAHQLTTCVTSCQLLQNQFVILPTTTTPLSVPMLALCHTAISLELTNCSVSDNLQNTFTFYRGTHIVQNTYTTKVFCIHFREMEQNNVAFYLGNLTTPTSHKSYMIIIHNNIS